VSGSVELIFVAVGRSEQQHHAGPGRDGLTVDAYLGGGRPGELLDRGFETKCLLDHQVQQRVVFGEACAVLRMQREVVEQLADAVNRRIVAADDDGEEVAQALLRAQWCAVFGLCLQESGEDIVARVRAAFGEYLLEWLNSSPAACA